MLRRFVASIVVVGSFVSQVSFAQLLPQIEAQVREAAKRKAEYDRLHQQRLIEAKAQLEVIARKRLVDNKTQLEAVAQERLLENKAEVDVIAKKARGELEAREGKLDKKFKSQVVATYQDVVRASESAGPSVIEKFVCQLRSSTSGKVVETSMIAYSPYVEVSTEVSLNGLVSEDVLSAGAKARFTLERKENSEVIVGVISGAATADATAEISLDSVGVHTECVRYEYELSPTAQQDKARAVKSTESLVKSVTKVLENEFVGSSVPSVQIAK